MEAELDFDALRQKAAQIQQHWQTNNQNADPLNASNQPRINVFNLTETNNENVFKLNRNGMYQAGGNVEMDLNAGVQQKGSSSQIGKRDFYGMNFSENLGGQNDVQGHGGKSLKFN